MKHRKAWALALFVVPMGLSAVGWAFVGILLSVLMTPVIMWLLCAEALATSEPPAFMEPDLTLDDLTDEQLTTALSYLED